MRNECLNLIGDEVAIYENDIAEGKEMVIYTKNENYTIWADAKGYRFHIQMNGEKTELKGYEIAADAICEAEDRK
jgi:hypothetical protein